MNGIWIKRSHIPAELFLSSRGNGVQRSAMERICKGNYFLLSRHDPGQLKGHTDGAGTSGSKKHAAQTRWQHLRKPGSQIGGRAIGIAPRRERQNIQLRLYPLQYKSVSIADLVHIVAMKIHIAPALDIRKPDTLARFQHVQTRRGQRL